MDSDQLPKQEDVTPNLAQLAPILLLTVAANFGSTLDTVLIQQSVNGVLRPVEDAKFARTLWMTVAANSGSMLDTVLIQQSANGVRRLVAPAFRTNQSKLHWP